MPPLQTLNPLQTLLPSPQTQDPDVPPGYMTPESLKKMREYAAALMPGGSARQPVHHYMQGISNMVSALAGKRMLDQANQADAASAAYNARSVGQPAGTIANPGAGAPGAAAPDDPIWGRNPLPPSPSGNTQATSARADDPRGMLPFIRAAATRYGVDPNIGEKVARSEGLRNFFGDNRTSFGAMQMHTGGGLGDNFRRDTGLDPADPRNEKATIDYAMKYAATHGWGPWHGAKNTGIPEFAGIPGRLPAQPVAYTDEGGSPSAGAAGGAAGLQQLAEGRPAAAGRMPGMVPPAGAAPSPGLVPARPPMTQRQFIGTQLPGASPLIQGLGAERYLSQNQPIVVPGTGGHWVVNPRDFNDKMWIADPQKMDIEGGEGVGVKGIPWMYGPGGQFQMPPGVGDVVKGAVGAGGGGGGQSELERTAPAPPTTGSPTTGPPPDVPPPPPSTTAPPAASPAGSVPGVVPPPAPGRVPAPTPISATPQEQPKAPQEKPTAPEGFKRAGAGRGQLFIPKDRPPDLTKVAEKPTKLAQAEGGGVGGLIDALGTLGAEQAAKKEGMKNAVKEAGDAGKAIIATGRTAQSKLSNEIPILQRALNDNTLWTGFGGDIVEQFKKMLAIGHPNAAAATEIFKKATSSEVLSDLKARLDGLGQVRLAELYLVAAANPNINNSLAANRFIVEVTRRLALQDMEKARLTADYMATHKYVDPKWQKLMLDRYDVTKNPKAALFTPEELEHWDQFMKRDERFDPEAKFGTEGAGKGGGKAAPRGPAVPAPPEGFE